MGGVSCGLSIEVGGKGGSTSCPIWMVEVVLGSSQERKFKLPLTSERKIVLPETSLVIPMTFLSSEPPRFPEIPFFFPISPPSQFFVS